MLNFLFLVILLVFSILFLILVVCDWFFGIVFVMKVYIIERKVKLVIIVVWVILVVVVFFLFVYRRVYEWYWKNYVERWCDDLDWSIDLGDGEFYFYKLLCVVYWMFVLVIFFFIFIIVMIGVYCGIIKIFWFIKILGEWVYKENLV